MNDRLGGLFPLTLLALLAGLTFWLERAAQPRGAPPAGVIRHEPDYIVQGLSAVRMDPQGQVQHTLRATRMTHYPDDDVTLLEEPKFVTYDQGRAPITVTSREASVSGNGENVYFQKDVRVVRAPVANQGELVLETEYLHVIPDNKIAKTDRPVTIRNAAALVTASGLELNSETRILKLQGRVRGTYERNGVRANGR